jgi:hypothetical protein
VEAVDLVVFVDVGDSFVEAIDSVVRMVSVEVVVSVVCANNVDSVVSVGSVVPAGAIDVVNLIVSVMAFDI